MTSAFNAKFRPRPACTLERRARPNGHDFNCKPGGEQVNFYAHVQALYQRGPYLKRHCDVLATVTNSQFSSQWLTEYPTAGNILHLQHLTVNEQDQTIKTNSELMIIWIDEYLSWKPEEFSNITSLLMKQKRLWVPDIVVGNAVSSQTEIGYKNLRLRIYSDGMVQWNPFGVVETTCEMDITYFPFDTQMCTIDFITASSVKEEIHVFIHKEEPIDTSDFSPDGLWDLVNYSAENSEQEHSRTKISFKLQLKRRWSYYVLNIILPILFLSTTSALSFALPSDAGDKMGLSITVLLTYAVYLTLIADVLPHTSIHVSVITVYVILLLTMSVTSVVLTAFILNFHHRSPSSPVKGCLARFVVILRSITFMKKLQPVGQEEEDEGGNEEKAELTGTKPESPMAMEVTHSGYRGGSRLKRDGVVKSVSGQEVGETLDRFVFLLLSAIVIGCTIACFIAICVGAHKQEKDTAAMLVARPTDH